MDLIYLQIQIKSGLYFIQNTKFINWRLVTIFFFTGLETLLFSGTYLGYNSLVPILKELGVFQEYCNPNKSAINQTLIMTGCSSSEVHFGRAFITWVTVQAVLGNVFGVMVDKLSFNIMKAVTAAMFLAGYASLALCSRLHPLFYVGGALLALAGHTILTANTAECWRLGDWSNTLLALNNSGYSASMLIMTLFTNLILLLRTGQLDQLRSVYEGLFLGFGLFGAGAILGSILVYRLLLVQQRVDGTVNPNHNITKIEPDTILLQEIRSQHQRFVVETFPTLWSAVFSPEFMFNFSFFLVSRYRYLYFISQMSLQTEFMFDNKTTVQSLLAEMNIYVVGGIVLGPAFGFLLDKYQIYTLRQLLPVTTGNNTTTVGSIEQSKSPESSTTKPTKVVSSLPYCSLTLQRLHKRLLFCFFPACLMEIASLFAMSILIMFPDPGLFRLGFCCMALARTLMMCGNSAYLMVALPHRLYGIIVSLNFSLSGLVVLSQQAIIGFSAPNSAPHTINYVMIAGLSGSFLHFGFLIFRRYS